MGLGLLMACEAFGETNKATGVQPVVPPPTPVSARDFYNVGVKQLAAGKLAEAETTFQGAINRQDEKVQSLALYNLGHVRFAIGSEQLKKCPASKPATSDAERAERAGQDAILSAEKALAANDVQQMVAAYQRGRGVRKELRAAYDAIYRALEAHRLTLEKWQRAMSDFRSAAELNPADTNALHNAEAVERALAKLVDSVMRTQVMTMKCGGCRSKLNDMMCQLKGRIPKDQMPPNAGNGDEEDELGEPKLEEMIGKKELAGKEGRELDLAMSPEDAASLLDSYKFGGNRSLPMGQKESGQPKDRKLRDW